MPDSETTPAEHLLDSYLKLRLNSIPDAGADREAMQDLRVDCLYALTDRSRHRRALVEGALVEEVRRLRSAALELGEVQPASVQEAVQPLVESRLITEHDAPSGQREVELAHDFAVRSVVQQWRALDRKRTARLALQQQERKRKDLQLAAAAGREKQVLRLVKLAPFGAVVGVLALALTLLLDRTEEIFRVEAFVWSILLAVGLGLAVASRRHLASLTLGAALAIIGLASIFAAPHRLDPPIWVGSVRLPAAIRFASSSRGLVGVEVRNRTKLSFSGYGDLVEPGEQPRQVMSLWNVSSYPGLQELAVDPGFHWIGVRYYEDALQITSDDVGPAGPRIVALRRVNEETYWPNYPTAILLAVLAVGLLMASLLNFSKLHQLTGGRKLAERGGRIVLAEFLDAGSTLLVIVLVGMLVDDATFTKSFQLDLMMGILFGGGGMALLRAELLRRWKRTPGLALAGLRLASRDGGPPGFRRLLARELLLMVWSLFNFAWGLPTFLGTPFIVRSQQKGQNFYDTWAGTRLVDVEVARAAEAAEDRATTQNARAA